MYSSSLIPFVLALFRERALRLTGPPEYARERGTEHSGRQQGKAVRHTRLGSSSCEKAWTGPHTADHGGTDYVPEAHSSLCAFFPNAQQKGSRFEV